MNIPTLYLVFAFIGALFIGLIMLLYYVRMKTRIQIMEIQSKKGRPKGPKRYFGTYGSTATMLTFIIATLVAMFESNILARFFLSFLITTVAIIFFYLYLNTKGVKTTPVEELGTLVFGIAVFYVVYKFLPHSFGFSIVPLSLTDVFSGTAPPLSMAMLAILLLLLALVIINHYTGFLFKRKAT